MDGLLLQTGNWIHFHEGREHQSFVSLHMSVGTFLKSQMILKMNNRTLFVDFMETDFLNKDSWLNL